MQAKLARFRKSGAIGADDYKALNDRLEETRANVGKAGAAMHKFSLNTAASRRELGYITKDLAMGQWGRLSQSFSTLAVRSGALNLIMSPLGIAIGATAVSLAVLIKAAFDGEREIFDFNKALLATGGYAGKTALHLSDMAEKVSEASGATLGASRDALEAVAASGRFTGKTFDLVVQAAAHMQEATGQSIGATIKKFEDIAKSPVDALLKLNETEHFLTESQLQRVQALQDEGREQDAASEASRIYASRLNDIASAADAATPHLSQMWKEAKKGASDAWEETKKFSEFLAAAA